MLPAASRVYAGRFGVPRGRSVIDGPGIPDIVVIGSASRDLAADDPRGWRLGGGVSYGALMTARLGLRTGALVGVDEPASTAVELDLLRAAGVDIRRVRLATGPVFENAETPAGRVQTCLATSDPIPAGAVPVEWRAAPAWLIVPVAGEVGEGWSGIPPADAYVGVGWQGLLRVLHAGRRVGRCPPAPSALLRRANVVGVSHHDVDPETPIGELLRLLGPRTTLVLTDGAAGGVVFEPVGRVTDSPAGGPGDAAPHRRGRRYPALVADATVDPTGAGDVFLAALVAARTHPHRLDGSPARGLDLLLAAAAGSLVVERPGLLGVPEARAIAARVITAPAASRRPGDA